MRASDFGISRDFRRQLVRRAAPEVHGDRTGPGLMASRTVWFGGLGFSLAVWALVFLVLALR